MEFSILNLLLVLLAAWLGGATATRLGYPSVLGELAVGILLGPPLLGLLDGSEALAVLADVGVLLMMLYIGMEIDPRELGKASKGGILAAFGGFVVPFGLGMWVVTATGGTLVAALFVGMAMGVTSLATKSRILVDLRILDTRIAHVMMAGALIADTLSLLVFAGILSLATAGSIDLLGVAIIAGKALLFFVAAWAAGIYVLPPLYRWLRRRDITGRTFNATLVLLIALVFAEGAHLAGLHGILGAFLAGLVLREAIAERRLSHDLTGLVRDVSLGFLAPIFFVTAGFQVSFGVFGESLGLLLAVIVLATLGKIVGTTVFYLPTGHGWREGLVIGTGMNGRGAVEIVVAGIGLQMGIISQEIFSILVFMAIATTATVPVLLKLGVAWLERRDEIVRSGPRRSGVVVVGAGPVAIRLASLLQASRGPDDRVVLIDRNERHCQTAEAAGLVAVHGDALDPATLGAAGADTAGTVIALTPNAEVNVLAAQRARERFLVPEVYALLTRESHGTLERLLDEVGGKPVTSRPIDLEAWHRGLGEDRVREVEWVVDVDPDAGLRERLRHSGALPLVVRRNGFGHVFPAVGSLRIGDEIVGLQVAET